MSETLDQSLNLTLLMPDRIVQKQPVAMVVVPGVEGDIGALPGHTPLLTRLRENQSVVVFDGQRKSVSGFFVDRGVVEITRTDVIVYGHYVELYALRSQAEIQSEIEESEDPDLSATLRVMLDRMKNLPYGLQLG